MPKISFLFLLQCVLSTQIHAQTTNKIDSIISVHKEYFDIPGISIGIVKNDSVYFVKSYGLQNIETKVKVTNETSFHSASVSKIFTAQGVLLLKERGKLNLDDLVITHIPELKGRYQDFDAITIRMLLNHSSGLGDIQNYHWKRNNISENSLEQYLMSANLKPKSTPGSVYNYSNLGYDLLGLLIAKISNSSFEDFMQKSVLESNEMFDSDYRVFHIPDSILASPHSKNKLAGNLYVRKTYPYTREHAPSSTLNTNVEDINNWVLHYFQNQNTLFAEMTTPSLESYPYIGLGFQLGSYKGYKTFGHLGGDKGFRSYLLLLPELELGIIILANSDYKEEFRTQIAKALIDHFL